VADSRDRPLEEGDLDPEPLTQFRAWFDEAAAAGVELPEAMALATAGSDGAPSVRMVLLKDADERGFAFVSAYGSRKGRELRQNESGALLFYWHPLGRQVRVEGAVRPTAADESDEYFRNRPRASRLSSAASPQSEVIESRAALEALVAEVAARHADGDVPRPDGWGGFRLEPETYEFWQHRADRLHDRFRYRRADSGWLIERLAP
jgi:pyridoxamine 5'-phosphate oxidase